MGDFSCYITIENLSPHPMSLVFWTESGRWEKEPGELPAGEAVQLALKDPPGNGSGGGLIARIKETKDKLEASFRDSYFLSNESSFSVTRGSETSCWEIFGSSEEDRWDVRDGVPAHGHPVFVRIGYYDPCQAGGKHGGGRHPGG